MGGFFLEVPYLDTLAILLPALFFLLPGGSKSDEERPDEPEDRPTAGAEEPETSLEALLERLLRRFGEPGSPDGR